VVLGVIVLISLSSNLLGQDELTAVSNRPTVSTPAQPVQPGVLETEWGLNAAASHQDINGLLKFGVSQNLELRFTNNPITADSGTHGVGDIAAGFKYRFTQDSAHRPSVSFMYMVKAPTAGDVLGTGEIDHAFTFLLSKDLGKHHFDFNTVVNLLGRPHSGFDHSVLNALAWSHPLSGKWGTTAEFSGTTSPNAVTPASVQLLAAATYAVRPRLVFDFGMAARITGDIPDATFIAGFTYSIADLYRRHSRVQAKPERR
jgi:Putative MetA-pathway of phenol degradation